MKEAEQGDGEEEEGRKERAGKAEGGVGGLRGVERWRGKMFGEESQEERSVERDQGRECFLFVLFLFSRRLDTRILSNAPAPDVLPTLTLSSLASPSGPLQAW